MPKSKFSEENSKTNSKAISTKSGEIKRKRVDTVMPERRMDEAFHILKNISDRSKPVNEKDECDIYAELLAKKLRQIDESNRLVVMHRIDNLIFEYRMNNAISISTASCSSSPQSITPLPFSSPNIILDIDSHEDTDNALIT